MSQPTLSLSRYWCVVCAPGVVLPHVRPMWKNFYFREVLTFCWACRWHETWSVSVFLHVTLQHKSIANFFSYYVSPPHPSLFLASHSAPQLLPSFLASLFPTQMHIINWLLLFCCWLCCELSVVISNSVSFSFSCSHQYKYRWCSISHAGSSG